MRQFRPSAFIYCVRTHPRTAGERSTRGRPVSRYTCLQERMTIAKTSGITLVGRVRDPAPDWEAGWTGPEPLNSNLTTNDPFANGLGGHAIQPGAALPTPDGSRVLRVRSRRDHL